MLKYRHTTRAIGLIAQIVRSDDMAPLAVMKHRLHVAVVGETAVVGVVVSDRCEEEHVRRADRAGRLVHILNEEWEAPELITRPHLVSFVE